MFHVAIYTVDKSTVTNTSTVPEISMKNGQSGAASP
jgi:hypothetical protein